jgi:hypothetical protein
MNGKDENYIIVADLHSYQPKAVGGALGRSTEKKRGPISESAIRG